MPLYQPEQDVVERGEARERVADDELLVVRGHEDHDGRAADALGIAPCQDAQREREQRDVVDGDERHEVAEQRDVDLHQRGAGTQRK